MNVRKVFFSPILFCYVYNIITMKLKMKKLMKDNKLIYDVFILQIKVETEEKFHNNDINCRI